MTRGIAPPLGFRGHEKQYGGFGFAQLVASVGDPVRPPVGEFDCLRLQFGVGPLADVVDVGDGAPPGSGNCL